MSKDMLGPVTRALVGVPQEYLGLMLDVVHKICSKDGGIWAEHLGRALTTTPIKILRSRVFTGVTSVVSLDGTHSFNAETMFALGLEKKLPVVYRHEGFISLVQGRLENLQPARNVALHTLAKEVTDRAILRALSEEKNLLLAFAHVYSFLLTAEEETDYLFFVDQNKETARMIHAIHTDQEGWRLADYLVGAEEAVTWSAGTRVVIPA